MADIIQLLPESIANQIAAGEVIQRPASVVKELIENAIDAEASYIQLIIKNAGKQLIQLIDNGKGMSETDARMSFERHATSKIKQANDIFSVKTKGFRGEALASIASIAHVEMKTRSEEAELGTKINIEASKIKKQEYCETAKGTSIAVKNLFFNVPARKKFLKKDATELSHILEEFKRVALAHPDIRFSVYSNDEEIYHLSTGTVRQRIISLFGKSYNEKLIPVNEETEVVNISGFIGNQDASRSSRGDQYLFVNNRFIRSNYLNHAIKNAYENIIADNAHPFYVIFLELDPATIDINIHPTKQEVKFEEEKLIYNFLRVTVKHGLGKYIITPVLDFEKELGLSHGQDKRSNGDNIFESKISQGNSNSNFKKEVPKWETLYADLKNEVSLEDEPLTLASGLKADSKIGSQEDQLEKPPYQIHNRYIVNQIKSGFIIIDQSHAHERILYEKYINQIENSNAEVQTLLFPVTVDLSKQQKIIVEEILEEINALGFEMELFGGDTVVIRGIPSGLEHENAENLIKKFIDQYSDIKDLDAGVNENLCRSLAYSARLKGNKKLDISEMKEIINSLFACSTPYSTPRGKKCFVTFELNDLQNKFQ